MRFLLMLAFLLSTSTVYAKETSSTAIFAGGCFWSMEAAFDDVPGVISAISGYTGGNVANPSYQQVSTGKTGHVEAVKIEYDPKKISYDQLLSIFWRNVDPFNDHGQFCDNGPEYRSQIFTSNEEQVRAAHASKLAVEKRLNKKTLTPIVPASTFYVAEEYHQNYKHKNPVQYGRYRIGCGRDRQIEAIWKGVKS